MSQTDRERRAILRTVASQLTDEPRLAHWIKNLARGFNVICTSSVVRTNELAWALYVQHKPQAALQVCSVLQGLPDVTESVHWFAVESALCLIWKLHVVAGQSTHAQICVNSIYSSYSTAWMKARARKLPFLSLKNRLLGSMMYAQKGFGPVDEGGFYAQRAKETVFLQMLGGSEIWPLRALDSELSASLERVRATRYYDRILA